jgi:hypothetical protein
VSDLSEKTSRWNGGDTELGHPPKIAKVMRDEGSLPGRSNVPTFTGERERERSDRRARPLQGQVSRRDARWNDALPVARRPISHRRRSYWAMRESHTQNNDTFAGGWKILREAKRPHRILGRPLRRR